MSLQPLFQALDSVQPVRRYGRVVRVVGLLVEVQGLEGHAVMGGYCGISTPKGSIPAEVVGFDHQNTLLMPFQRLEGVGLGTPVYATHQSFMVRPNRAWLGRVINALGEPLDDGPPLPQGASPYSLYGSPPPAHKRCRVGARLDMGIRVINTFVTCCQGQRMGIFAGSGVGKSTLLSMMARYTRVDVIVIGLVGERGREVQEFLQEHLGPEGIQRSVVVVATSDESPLMRRGAAHMTLTLAEYYRDQGLQVLCLMDSVTRFAMAQREIGLTVGEPPATRGYPPSVFAELPKLLERAGPGMKNQGSITGIFAVLVDGDDHNEPIADAVRGILDGHIVLDRKIAERGRFPSVNILKSVSRTMPGCNQPHEQQHIRQAIKYEALYDDMADMVRLGAYRRGSDPDVDQAVTLHPPLEAFLSQRVEEPMPMEACFDQLAQVMAPFLPHDPAAQRS